MTNIIQPPTAEQQIAMNKAWKESAAKNRTNPLLTQAERDRLSQELLERSTNPNYMTDSQMRK